MVSVSAWLPRLTRISGIILFRALSGGFRASAANGSVLCVLTSLCVFSHYINIRWTISLVVEHPQKVITLCENRGRRLEYKVLKKPQVEWNTPSYLPNPQEFKEISQLTWITCSHVHMSLNKYICGSSSAAMPLLILLLLLVMTLTKKICGLIYRLSPFQMRYVHTITSRSSAIHRRRV